MGGSNGRSFTDIDDGIAALIKIIENKNGCATGRIFNLGNPNNDVSIKELAELLVELIKQYPAYQEIAEKVRIVPVSSNDHYGVHYQDIDRRVPSIQNAQTHLGWSPTVNLREALKKTLDYHLNKPAMSLNDQEAA